MTTTRPSPFCVAMFAILLSGLHVASAADWSRFRGPDGAGVSTDSTDVPTTWSPTENVKWKVELPGSGVSSPIVVGDKVFVTCYSGYGLDRQDPGEIENLKRHLVCVDRNTGKELWQRAIDAVLPEDPYTGIGVTAHGYASHTPVSDGTHVFAFFGKTGVIAFDMDGKQVWQTSVGTGSDPRRWGSSSSPILYGDKLIVTASAESQSIVALDKATGSEIWRQQAAGLDNMWGTPVVVNVEDRSELVLSVPGELWGINPENGKLRWYCESSEADQANTSAVVGDGVVFAITGRGGASTAVKLGGKGDVSKSHLVWSGKDTSRFGSPILHDGKLYLVANGIVKVMDAESGDVLTQARLTGGTVAAGGGGGRGGGRGGEGGGRGEGGRGEGGRPEGAAQEGGRGGQGGGPPGGGPPGGGGRGGGRGGFGGGRGGGFGSLDYASPVIAGSHLYYINGKGETFVFELGEELKQVAVNKLAEGEESFGGTPAISDNQLLIRSSKYLYCVGK